MNLRMLLCGIALASCLFGASARAQEFYASKTINLYIAFPTGGAFDLYSRLAARHLGNHIGGKPRVIPQNMPGAGGLKLASFMYNVAPTDGTAIAMPSNGIVTDQVIKSADSNVDYDARKFNWIGRLNQVTSVYVAWHTSPIKSYSDLRQHEGVMGSTASVSTLYLPRGLNLYGGAKFKLITGYQSSNEVLLAMERGEVEIGNADWSNFKNQRADWLRDKKVNVLLFSAERRLSDMPEVPVTGEVSSTERDRQVINLLTSSNIIGRTLFTNSVPSPRLDQLRKAFMSMLDDTEFKKDAEKSHLDLDPMNGKGLQDMIEAFLDSPQEVLDATRQVAK
jgi:tripartite-type tricarboxylate transporter receptor subunit TctC